MATRPSKLTDGNTVINQAGGSINTNFNIPATGANRVAYSWIYYCANSGLTINTPTLGGTPMVQVGSTANNTNQNGFLTLWRLVNPTTGASVALAATVSGSINQAYFIVFTLQDVDQTTPERVGTFQKSAATDQSDGSSHYSQTVTSDVNDLTISGFSGTNAGINGTNQTIIDNNQNGTHCLACDRGTTGAATVTHQWTLPASNDNVVMSSVSVQSVQSTPSTPPSRETAATEIGHQNSNIMRTTEIGHQNTRTAKLEDRTGSMGVVRHFSKRGRIFVPTALTLTTDHAGLSRKAA